MDPAFRDQLKQAAQDSLNWLLTSYHHFGQGGFPHSRWMYLPSFLAWQKDYPETSGYLIENLLSSKNATVISAGINCAHWLQSIQSKDGFYHSGVDFNTKSAFNTAQILFGLDAAYKFSPDPGIFLTMEKSYDALLNNIDAQGIFKSHLYQPGYFASYYSRCIWPLLQIDQTYFNNKNVDQIEKSLNYLFKNKNEFGFFDNCGFEPNNKALSHPVAYALEGFLESAILLNDQHIEKYILEILNRICDQIHSHHKIPAYYENNITGDYSFICVTGQIQICVLLLKAYQRTYQNHYKEAAEQLIPSILQWQIKSGSAQHKGACPSSIPIWKNYFPFRYTNWTVKFFLDLCQLWDEIDVREEG